MGYPMIIFLKQGYSTLYRKVVHHYPVILAMLVSLMLTGCAQVGAPAFTLLGSFIPYWMVCAAIGLVIAIIVRVVFIKTGIDDVLPLRLLVYLCLMLTVSFISALLFFVG